MLTHEQTTKLTHKIATRLLDRLEFITLQPGNILDLGCLDEYLLDQLAINYPTAELYGLNIAINTTIDQIKYKNIHNIFCANLDNLPLADSSLDLIVSNLAIDCLNINIDQWFKELHRVIKPDGLLLFTMFNTTKLDNNALLKIGDVLLNNRFCDPVVDQELININYKSNNIVNKIENVDQIKTMSIEVLYGHALGSYFIKTPIDIDC